MIINMKLVVSCILFLTVLPVTAAPILVGTTEVIYSASGPAGSSQYIGSWNAETIFVNGSFTVTEVSILSGSGGSTGQIEALSFITEDSVASYDACTNLIFGCIGVPPIIMPPVFTSGTEGFSFFEKIVSNDMGSILMGDLIASFQSSGPIVSASGQFFVEAYAEVTPVPLPASFWLLLSGMISFYSLFRKKSYA